MDPTPRRLNLSHQRIDPREVELLTVNARFMTHDQFQRLVDNVRRDGALTSSPLLYWPPSRDRPLCLSGNHRTRAAVAAELELIDVLVVSDELTESEQKAMQLAHNAVEGQDDPSTLRALFDSIEGVDERLYTGLDDQSLDLLIDVDLPSLGDLAPRWHTLTFLLLDDEAADFATVFDEAAHAAGPADAYWLGRLDAWDSLLAHLQTVRSGLEVHNRAVGLQVMCDVFRAHVTDLGPLLQLDADSARDRMVPLAPILGYDMPAGPAAALEQAIRKVASAFQMAEPWRALEMLTKLGLSALETPPLASPPSGSSGAVEG